MMKRQIFSFLITCLLSIAFCKTTQAQGSSLQFHKVIDTVIVIDIPCCTDLYNNPYSTDVIFPNIAKIVWIGGANHVQYGFNNCSSTQQASNFSIQMHRIILSDGVEGQDIINPNLEDKSSTRHVDIHGVIWLKAGSGIRIKVTASSNAQFPCSPNHDFVNAYKHSIHISGLEFIQVPH